MRRIRRVLARLGLVVLGLVLALLLLEVALQAGARIVASLAGDAPSWLTSDRRVLCLGDSNTYGLWLPDRADAYPPQFEQLWNDAVGSPRIEVLNLGYPGNSSSRLRHDFERMLDVFRPDVVLILIGANDYWTTPVPVGDDAAERPGLLRILADHSRAYRFLAILARSLDRRAVDVQYAPHDAGEHGTIRYGNDEFAIGWQRGNTMGRAQQDTALEDNLRSLAEQARTHGARVAFMTYASEAWNYGDANRVIRRAADASGAVLVDVAAAVQPACPREPCLDLLYEDHHPTARGYRIVAETLVRHLLGDPALQR